MCAVACTHSFLQAAPPRIRKELRSIIAARQAAATSSDDESEDSAPTCASVGDAASEPESAGSVSVAESAAHHSAGSRHSSDLSAAQRDTAQHSRKRVAPQKRGQQPLAKRQRTATASAPAKLRKVVSRSRTVQTAATAPAPKHMRRTDKLVKKQPAVGSRKAAAAVSSPPARRRRAPLMRASLELMRRRRPSTLGRSSARAQTASATAAKLPEVSVRVSSRPLRLAAQGVQKLVEALVKGRP